MKLHVLAIGKKHDAALVAAIDDYTQRLQHYTPLTWQLLPSARGKMTAAETKRVEGAVLLASLQDDDYVVLLDERGIQLTSEGLAAFLGQQDMRNTNRVVFIIGGAFGVSEDVMARANKQWSLSPLVFPHQLVRLILAEQLYRASTIRRGEPYHHV